MLVTKLLQHLANGMTSFREVYMNGLDPFVAEHSKTIGDLCDNFAVIPPDSPPGKSVHIPSEQQEEDLKSLHHHISMSHEKIAKILENQQNRETAEKYELRNYFIYSFLTLWKQTRQCLAEAWAPS